MSSSGEAVSDELVRDKSVSKKLGCPILGTGSSSLEPALSLPKGWGARNRVHHVSILRRGFLLSLLFFFALGCKPSPYVRTTITNSSGDNLQQVELDYPSASFGRDKIAAGAVYAYRFKILGRGKPKLQFLDSAGKPHQAEGPELHEGQAGTLDIRIAPAYSVAWAWTAE